MDAEEEGKERLPTEVVRERTTRRSLFGARRIKCQRSAILLAARNVVTVASGQRFAFQMYRAGSLKNVFRRHPRQRLIE